ncbi:ATP-binding cassette domain-containing protein [Actinoplanes sp. NPDC051851]|uniref:ATP-binding cassette domain-containing protein n=1 Tax=Actinoplanes sp. NPDC051851 TaxID=3154753 RepID=UPI003420B156
MIRMRPGLTGPLTVGAGALLALTLAPYTAHSVTLWVVYGLLALSFTFVWGHGGIFSLGQAAFFGIGGYAYGVAGINLVPSTGESLSSLLIAALVAAAVAALLGYFVFYGDVGDVYLAVITIATTLVLLTFFASTSDSTYRIGNALLGGYNGMVGIPGLVLPGGQRLTANGVLAVVVLIAGGVAIGIAVLLRRPFGRVLAGIRENEVRTQLLGYEVRARKLGAFVIGGFVAGLAGALYAAWGNFINPQVFSLQQASLVAIWTLVGGRRSIPGAFAGAFAVQALSDYLGGVTEGAVIPAVLGAILLVVVLFLPEGVLHPLRERVLSAVRKGTDLDLGVAESDPDPEAAFGRDATPASRVRTVDVQKRFGGLRVLRGVTLDVAPNEVRTVIGPNGAGKSTFFGLLTGRHRPDAGEILLDGVRLNRLRPEKRARLGLGIKTQVPSIYPELSVAENVWIAAYGAGPDAEKRVAEVLAGLRLTGKAQLPAGALAHGEQQWLEIGMVLVRRPRVVLLDEPTAGMTRAETSRYVELIAVLARSATVLVVEHDMEFVRDLGAPVTMLHEGTVFAEGSIAELRADDRVLDVYLGRAKADA